MEQDKESITKKSDKKESRLVLNNDQRQLYQKKILLYLTIGSFIWLMSEIFFSYLFQFQEVNRYFFTLYPIFIAFFVICFYIYFILSKHERHNLSLFTFFVLSFLAGTILLPFSLFLPFIIIQVHMFVFLIFATSGIVLVIGVILGNQFFFENTLWRHIILFIGLMGIVEIIFVLLFNIQNFFLTIPLITAEIIAVGLLLLYYGPIIIKKSESSSWSFVQFKLQSYFLLILVGLLITAIIVLIIIVLSIIAGDAVDISGFGDFFNAFTPSYRRKKKKKEDLPK